MESGPELLKEVLSRLFAARGWGRKQERIQLEEAWTAAAGPDISVHTRVAALKRGVLEIEVDHAVLLQELAHYHKRKLLDALKKRLTGRALKDLRFRVGAWGK